MKALIILIQPAFDWTWKNSLQVAVLVGLVLLVQTVLARWLTPRLRYALSLLILLRLLLPAVPSSPLSLENLFRPAARLEAHSLAPERGRLGGASLPDGPISPMVTEPDPVAPTDPLPVVTPFVSAAPSRVPVLSVAEVLGLAWACGLLALVSLAGWRYAEWSRLIRQGRRLSDPRLLALLDDAREAMGVRRSVTLVAMASLSSPAVFGFRRVRLLLPETMLDQLTDQDLRLLFLHEMAHVRRHDMLLNVLLMAVQFVHWFNPLLWLGLHRLRADRELVCDAMVLQRTKPEERVTYGSLLLKLLTDFPAEQRMIPTAVPVVSSQSELKRRIVLIKHQRSASRGVYVVTVMAAVALACLTFTGSSQQPPVVPESATAQAAAGASSGSIGPGRPAESSPAATGVVSVAPQIPELGAGWGERKLIVAIDPTEQPAEFANEFASQNPTNRQAIVQSVRKALAFDGSVGMAEFWYTRSGGHLELVITRYPDQHLLDKHWKELTSKFDPKAVAPRVGESAAWLGTPGRQFVFVFRQGLYTGWVECKTELSGELGQPLMQLAKVTAGKMAKIAEPAPGTAPKSLSSPALTNPSTSNALAETALELQALVQTILTGDSAEFEKKGLGFKLQPGSREAEIDLNKQLYRQHAATALTKRGTNAWPVVPALLSAVTDKDMSVGVTAADTLVGIRAEASPEWARSRNVLVGQTNAARVFRYLVVGRDTFAKTYDAAHRRFGLVGLAATGPASGIAYPDIVDVLKHDKELEVRACAAMVLGGLETERKATVVLLKGVLQDKEEWPLVSAAAAKGLATAAPAEAETGDLLRQALQDNRSAVRVAAARALWRMKAPVEEVLPVLTALLNHKLASTRAGALNGLSEMGSAARPSVPEVQRLTSDEDESVRRAAAEALKNITKRAQGDATSGSLAASAHPAIDLVEAGTLTTWGNGRVLYVGKRERNSLKDVHILDKIPNGQSRTVRAERGILAEGSSQSTVKITLLNGTAETDETKATFQELTFELGR